jgi:chromate transport protein ChrA
MIWVILTLYGLPFLLCCILGYYKAKEQEETIGEYLQGVLFCLLPIINILFLVMIVVDNIKNNKSVQDFLNKKI